MGGMNNDPSSPTPTDAELLFAYVDVWRNTQPGPMPVTRGGLIAACRSMLSAPTVAVAAFSTEWWLYVTTDQNTRAQHVACVAELRSRFGVSDRPAQPHRLLTAPAS